MASPSVADQLKNQLGATADRIKNPQAGGDGRVGSGPDRPKPAVVRLADIEVDPSQPRRNVGDIEDLVASIAEHGLLQPLIVSAAPPGNPKRYRLIAGERRFHASQRLALETVPAIIRNPSDQQRLQIQLIENLHRKNLNAIEEAEGYQRLMDEFGLFQSALAKQFGKSRVVINETIRLLSLPAQIIEWCRTSDTLSRSVLLEIAKQPTVKAQFELWRQAKEGELTVQKARAQSGKKAFPDNAPKKPKAVYSTRHGFTIILQSETPYEISRKKQIAGLTEVLRRLKSEK